MAASDRDHTPNVQEFFLALPVLLFSMVAHEYAHGFAALKQGDSTALDHGRLTLNPIKHLDLWFTILMPTLLFFASAGQVVFGGAKPIPVNPGNYRSPRRGDVIVSSAGMIVNLCLAAIFTGTAIGVGILGEGQQGTWIVSVQRMMLWGVWMNLLLAFFNLIPIPPLDGSRLLYHLLPPIAQTRFNRVAPFGFVIMVGILFLVPQLLHTMLAPAFAAERVSCALAAPYLLRGFPLCPV